MKFFPGEMRHLKCAAMGNKTQIHVRSSMIDIINEEQENTQQKLLEDMKEFPCLFNIATCKLDVGNASHNGMNICEPDLSKNNLQFLREDLEDDNDDSDFEETVWKENLLTFVLAELGALDAALKLNRKIQDEHGMNTLVTLANAVFLLHRKGNFNRAREIIDDLRKLKSDKSFVNLKTEAVCELGYAFLKFGGAKHLLCSISLLEFSLSLCQDNEQFQFMLAVVYRRCTHFHIYTADPENINRHDCALKAATSLYKLGTTAESKSIKAAAMIELAFCKYNDDIQEERDFTGKKSNLSREEWFEIVQERTWRQLCEEAINISGDNPTQKVLKMAGQLYRYFDTVEDLNKSEELLKKAIEIKPSKRAYHHLGLTYRKMAVQFERERRQNMHQRYFNQKNTEGAVGGSYDRHRWSKQQDRFSRSARDTESANSGNQNVRYSYKTRQEHKRREYNKHQWGFKNNTQDKDGGGFNVLPVLSLNNSPQNLDTHLKCIIRVPRVYLQSFRKDNTFAQKAITQLEKADEISHHQNIPAVYDLALMLAQTGRYDESKQMCKILISECISPNQSKVNDPVSLVNAYNLYGMCCAKQAELLESDIEADMSKGNINDLQTESEKYLTRAVRLASHLAGTVPELEMCATDLWNAFRTLQKTFTFVGQKESREKLFRMCEFISDYRCLEAIDAIVSQDPNELKKIEVIEQCLQRYLNMKAYDTALLFRDLINLHPEVRSNLPKSRVYKQLMLEVAEGKLAGVNLQMQREAYHPDPIWKQLFNEQFHTAGSAKKYDIVIVDDVDDDYEPKWGWIISENMKVVLQQTFGLNVVHAHEEGCPGSHYLEEQLKIISNSSVAIFILTDPCLGSPSLELDMARLRVSESEHSVQENASVNKESKGSCPEGAMAGSQNENENSLSRKYERIINASISNFLNNIGATRVMLVVPDSLKSEDLPQAVRGLPTVALSQSEIETLRTTAQDRSNQQRINIMKNLFRAVVDNFQVGV